MSEKKNKNYYVGKELEKFAKAMIDGDLPDDNVLLGYYLLALSKYLKDKDFE